MTVHYAAVHARNSWRIHSKHDSLESATTGDDGAMNLLRNIGRVGQTMRRRHGLVYAVFVWEDAMQEATAFRLVPGASDQIETAKVAVSKLIFKNGDGPSLEQIEAWFSPLPPNAATLHPKPETLSSSKYDPLIAHLAGHPDDRVNLSFAEVESLLGDRLPASARSHPAWWGNTTSDPTHTWANRWTALGWRAVVDLPREHVVFSRSDESAPASTLLAALLPTGREAVMDLVERAGIDVSAWRYTADGRSVDNPRANPHYCYDWSFGSAREGFLVCIWHGNLREQGGRIVSSIGISEQLRSLEDLRDASSTDGARRSRIIQKIRRAREFKEAIEQSLRRNQPLRAIINSGRQPLREEIGDGASRVDLRALDEAHWYVHSQGGAFDRWQLVRGVAPCASEAEAEQPDVADCSSGADDVRRLTIIKVRRGQAEFRGALIGAYTGKCAVTRSRIVDLLEAAHILPHSEGTDYRVSNGLLLRADIHTLYDLHLLSIDERYRVHLSKTIELSEYRRYHGGELLALPTALDQVPCAESLRTRHQRFLTQESAR